MADAQRVLGLGTENVAAFDPGASRSRAELARDTVARGDAPTPDAGCRGPARSGKSITAPHGTHERAARSSGRGLSEALVRGDQDHRAIPQLGKRVGHHGVDQEINSVCCDIAGRPLVSRPNPASPVQASKEQLDLWVVVQAG